MLEYFCSLVIGAIRSSSSESRGVIMGLFCTYHVANCVFGRVGKLHKRVIRTPSEASFEKAVVLHLGGEVFPASAVNSLVFVI